MQALHNLVEMGFGEKESVEALRRHGNREEDAVSTVGSVLSWRPKLVFSISLFQNNLLLYKLSTLHAVTVGFMAGG